MDKDYKVASISQEELDEIIQFENQLNQDNNNQLVLIAYEKANV